MERIGFDGFEWEEIEVNNLSKRELHGDIYLYRKNGKANAMVVYVRKEFIESAGLVRGDKLQLMAQGKAIFMLKKSKVGTIEIHKPNGTYYVVGASDLGKKLEARAETTDFEVIEAVDGYIMFRPVRK